jgi:HEAT repeat protein
MEVSIVIRFRNEARYLAIVLDALRRQEFSHGQFEIVAVDSGSTDASLEICRLTADKVLSTDTYRPGKALNTAIELSGGRSIAVLSAHTIPSNSHWLETLYSHRNDSLLAGVYGAQLYPINSKFLDKRDLDIFSSTSPRQETHNSDFWNANSLFSRQVWRRQHFDETVYELEDHYWTKQLLPLGYQVVFEPCALVYHYGHIKRIDREYLEASGLSEVEQIENAVAQLNSCEGDWPLTMRAGLTLSSLTHVKEIEKAIPAIGNTLLTHWDFDVRWRMAQALGKIPSESSAIYLVNAMANETSFYPRDEAAWSLGRLGGISVPSILKNMHRYTPETLPFAALALGKSGQRDAAEKAIQILLAEFESGDTKRQRNAAYFAGELAGIYTSERAIPYLEDLLRNTSDDSLHVFCWALGCFAEKDEYGINWNDVFAISTSCRDLPARFEATAAIGKHAKRSLDNIAITRVLAQMNDSESRVRYAAFQSIRLILEGGRSISLPPGFHLWEDDDFGVMYEKSLILGMVQGS